MNTSARSFLIAYTGVVAATAGAGTAVGLLTYGLMVSGSNDPWEELGGVIFGLGIGGIVGLLVYIVGCIRLLQRRTVSERRVKTGIALVVTPILAFYGVGAASATGWLALVLVPLAAPALWLPVAWAAGHLRLRWAALHIVVVSILCAGGIALEAHGRQSAIDRRYERFSAPLAVPAAGSAYGADPKQYLDDVNPPYQHSRDETVRMFFRPPHAMVEVTFAQTDARSLLNCRQDECPTVAMLDGRPVFAGERGRYAIDVEGGSWQVDAFGPTEPQEAIAYLEGLRPATAEEFAAFARDHD